MTATLERAICAPLPRYIALMEEALDAWQGEPEELGALLDVATSRVDRPCWYRTRQQWRMDIAERAAARQTIMALPNGAALLLSVAAH